MNDYVDVPNKNGGKTRLVMLADEQTSSCNSDLLLSDRLEQGIGCMEGLIEYVNDFGADIDPNVVKAEVGEAILRMKGTYGQ